MSSELPATQQPDSPIHCAVLRTTTAFDGLEEEYRSLIQRSCRATVYQSWEWLRTWWQTFEGPGTGLYVLTFRQDERLVGCAPLVLRRPGRLPLRRLEPIGVLRSDYLDLVIQDGLEEETLTAFEYHLHRSQEWDMLDLQQLPEDSPTLAYFRKGQEELDCVIREQEICPYAPLPATWPLFLAGLGKKNRYNVGYYRRLLDRDFEVTIGRAGPEDLESWMEELFRLHQLRWRKRHLPGALYSPSVRTFHRRVASALLRSDKLDLYRLALNGHAVAMLYCFGDGGRGYYYLGGFDPGYARYSVGTVLTAYAIQQSIGRSHEVFDFLRGSEPYKYRWNVQEKRNYRVEWRRDSLGSQALYALNQATRAIEHQAKMIARRLEK